MTDNEIIEALECCKIGNCDDCPFYGIKEDCEVELPEEGLDLINRQKAEIERLNAKIKAKDEINYYNMGQLKVARDDIETAKSEAIKEFVERLKGVAYDFRFGERGTQKMIYANDIDNLVKEMTEENQIENEFNYTKMYKAICDLTAEDVKEIQHGKWIDIPFGCSPSEHGSYDGRTKCSVCGFVMSRLYYKYCPCCGARMDGETNEI